MTEDETCCTRWHEELVVHVINWLEGHAVGTAALRRRNEIAAFLAKHERFNTRGDHGHMMAKAVPDRLSHDPPPTLRDFRSDEQREEDAKLEGVCYRCEIHGLSRDAIVLCSAAYCPVDDCSLRVLSVGPMKEQFAR